MKRNITDNWVNLTIKLKFDVYPLRNGKTYIISKPPAGETNNFLHIWVKKNDKYIKVYHYQFVIIIN